jgi:hypothetical protein
MRSFYKKLNRIARKCQLTRYDALRLGLDALLRETEVRNSALNRNIRNPAQSEVFRRTMGQVSRNYWATISVEEKRERETKCAGALGSESNCEAIGGLRRLRQCLWRIDEPPLKGDVLICSGPSCFG